MVGGQPQIGRPPQPTQGKSVIEKILPRMPVSFINSSKAATWSLSPVF